MNNGCTTFFLARLQQPRRLIHESLQTCICPLFCGMGKVMKEFLWNNNNEIDIITIIIIVIIIIMQKAFHGIIAKTPILASLEPSS